MIAFPSLLSLFFEYFVFGDFCINQGFMSQVQTNQLTPYQYRNVRINVPGTNSSIALWTIFRENHANLDDPNTDTVIYVHGRGYNRAFDHRVELYKVLSRDYHVITFDYRGFGDSSCVLKTERSVVVDTITVINWVKANTRSRNIRMWGHSLGTGIVLEAMYYKNDPDLKYLVLESPFNQFSEAIRNYKFMQAFSRHPIFDKFVTNPIVNSGHQFQSDSYLGALSANVLILHAKDDDTVPFHLGKKLFDANADKPNLQMVAFAENFGYEHIYIYKYPKLLEIVGKFFHDQLPYRYQELNNTWY